MKKMLVLLLALGILFGMVPVRTQAAEAVIPESAVEEVPLPEAETKETILEEASVPQTPEGVISSGFCGAQGSNVTWTVMGENGDCTLYISGTGAMVDYEGDDLRPWSYYAYVNVVIGDGITHLGSHGFPNSRVVSVIIPDSVTSIGSHCFSECGFTSITIPDSVTSLGDSCFSYCNSLTSITIPDGVTSLGDSCFSGCKSLSSITIPDSVTSLGDSCFSGCESLSSITIPDSVASLGDSCFADCDSLTSITIPDSVTSLGDNCFWYCNSLTSIIIPDGVTILADSCFQDCTSLTSITLPEGVTSLGWGCFQGCTSLSDIIIPKSVRSIGNWCFMDCTSLTSAVIPDGVRRLEPACFKGCTSLTNVTIPDGVYYLGWEGFSGCTSLSDIELPTLSTIGDLCFANNTALTKIQFNGSAPDVIGPEAFLNVTAEVRYPWLDETWTTFIRKDYGGDLEWIGYFSTDHVHEYSDVKVTEPTCTEQGYTTYSCSCGHHYQDNLVPAKGHTENVVRPAQEPTCTKTGLTERIKCKACGIVIQEQSEIPAKGHVENIVRQGKPATCTATGLTEKIKCKVCNLVIQDQTVIPVLGHDYVNWYCTRCGLDDPNMPIPDHVDRVSGKDRHETAFQVANLLKQVLGIEKFDTILIASGSDSADALAGSYLAVRKNAPILLSRGSSHQRNLEYIQANLAPGGIVYILGGTGAVPQEMEDLLIANHIPYERLKGKTRFDTNLAILDKAVVEGDEILVSTGYNFADSLSASAVGKPILLLHTNANVLTDAQKVWLEGHRGKTFTIIGGTGAVSEALEAALQEYGTTTRLKGSGREATSVAVAQTYFSAPTAAFIAYSRNFPDGLCGGPLAHAIGAPLLLVNAKMEGPARDYVTANNITKGYILGGSGAVRGLSANIVFGE